MGVGGGIRRGWLVGGVGLVLLGVGARSLGRSWSGGGQRLGSLPGLLLLVIGVNPHSRGSAVVGEVVLDGSSRPLGNEAHVQGFEIDEESVGNLGAIENFGNVGGVSGKGSQSHKCCVVDVDSDGVRQMLAIGRMGVGVHPCLDLRSEESSNVVAKVGEKVWRLLSVWGKDGAEDQDGVG